MTLVSPAWMVTLLPLLAAAVLAAVPRRAGAAWINLAAAVAAFALACRLPWEPGVARVDAHLAMLAGFVGAVGAWTGRTEPGDRIFFVLYQLLLALTLFALLTKNPEIAWLGIAASVIAVAVAIGSPMTSEALAAAWRYLVPGAVGLALALFGMAMLAIDPTGAPGGDAAFVLVVVGFGAIVVLAPRAAWMPGVLQLPPLLMILRLLSGQHGRVQLMSFGLATLLLAAAAASRQRDFRNCLGCAAVAQLGVVLFAFGLGSAAAVFAGLLHLTLLTLTRSAALQCADRSGFSRAAATVALAGLPPFGLFASSFLIVMATVEKSPWLLAPLGLGLVVSAWALVARVADGGAPGRADLVPAWVLLGAGIVLGVAMPAPVAAWFSAVAAELQ